MKIIETPILNSNGCILTSSIKLKKNGQDFKLSKGTIISSEIIKLFEENKLRKILCVRTTRNDIHENVASEQISRFLIPKNFQWGSRVDPDLISEST